MSHPGNDEILERLYEEEYEAIYLHILNWSEEDWVTPTKEDRKIMHEEAAKRAKKRFEELSEPLDLE